MPKDIPRHIPIPIPAMLFNEFMKTTLQSIAAIIPIVTPIIILLLFMVFILLKSRLRFHFFKKFNNCYILLLNSPQSKKAEPVLLRLCLSLFSFYTAAILLLLSHKRSHRQELSYPLLWT